MRQPYLRNALLQLSGCELKIFWCSVWGEAHNTHEIVTKRCKHRGFRDFEVVRKKTWNEGELKRSKMARACPFNNGVLMLRNISAPFLNALKDNPRWRCRCFGAHNWIAFTGGRSVFFFFHFRSYLFTKKNAFLNLLAKKKRPEIEHNNIYIYIHTFIFIYLL